MYSNEKNKIEKVLILLKPRGPGYETVDEESLTEGKVMFSSCW